MIPYDYTLQKSHYSWPLNNKGLNWAAPLIRRFFSVNACIVFDLQLGVYGCGGHTLYIDRCFLYKGLEQSKHLGTHGGLDTNTLRILKDNLSFWGVKSYTRIFQLHGGVIAPSPALFKGQLYIILLALRYN